MFFFIDFGEIGRKREREIDKNDQRETLIGHLLHAPTGD